MIKNILENHASKNTIVLDAGANFGIHGLYAAKLGYRVWAVEPQERNLIKVLTLVLFNRSLTMVSRIVA